MCICMSGKLNYTKLYSNFADALEFVVVVVAAADISAN